MGTRRAGHTRSTIALVAVLLTASVPLAVAASSPPPSKVERVQAVAKLFGTQPAIEAARRLAGIESSQVGDINRPAESRSTQSVAASPVPEVALAPDSVADGGVAPEPSSAAPPPSAGFFDPFAPMPSPTPLTELLPDVRTDGEFGELGAAQCPVPGGTFWNDWGQPRSNGRFHQGTDLIANHGAPVYAMWDATVGRIDESDDYVAGSEEDLGGITVSYTTADGTRVYNGHLALVPAYIRPGVRITAGTIIGFVGQTGNAQRSVPHLHIEVHPDGGEAVNPYPLLDQICER